MENQPTSSKKPSGCARIIAVLLMIAFALLTPLAFLAFDVYQVAFNPALVKRVITDEVVNHALVPAFLQSFSEAQAKARVEKGNLPAESAEPKVTLLLSFMKQQAWEKVKTEVLPPEILTEWVSATVDGVYAWIDSNDGAPQITWPMQSFKNRVNTEHGRAAMLIAYQSLPLCTQSEVDDYLARALAASPQKVLFNLCQFPEPWRAEQASGYLDAVQEVVGSLPNTFDFTAALAANAAETSGPDFASLKIGLRLLRLAGGWVWLVPLGLLLLILILVPVRTLRRLKWGWGVPLSIAGLLALGVALGYSGPVTNFLTSRVFSQISPAIQQEVLHAVLWLGAEVFQPMLIQAAVILLLGLVIIGLHRLRRRPKNPPTKKAAPALRA